MLGLSGIGIQGSAFRRPERSFQERSGFSRSPDRPAFPPVIDDDRFPKVVAETVGGWFEHGNESTSVCFCEASVRPGVNGTCTLCPAFLRPTQWPRLHPERLGRRAITFCHRLRTVEVGLNALQPLQRFRQFVRSIGFPTLLRCETNARPVRAAAQVGAAEGGGRRPGGPYKFRYG